MKRMAVYGVGAGIGGRDAGMQAAQRALDQLGTARPALAVVFAAQEFQMSDVLAGLSSLLGETPLWGFSTTCAMTGGGEQPRSVVVALLAGSDYRAPVLWLPNYSQDSPAAARLLVEELRRGVFLPHTLILAADGMHGSLVPVCDALAGMDIFTAGGMAAGDPSIGKTWQLAGSQAGPGGLSALALSGRLRAGIGLAQGWHDLGVYYHATRTRDVWLQALDGIPAAEAYARLFGYSAREWAFPPLSEMARLYPLGIETQAPAGGGAFAGDHPGEMLIRSALRVEVDGSLRMSAPVPQGAVVHMLAGDADACLFSARQAVRSALANLGKEARPILAVALVDAAWQLLFESRPGALCETLSAELRTIHADLPLVGAYTYGQLARPALDRPAVLHNQNLELILIGEAKE